MASVIIFGPTGQVGSMAALTAASLGAHVHLAMRNTDKPIPGLSASDEQSGNYTRIQADLVQPESVRQAVKTSGAKRAFIYLVHGVQDYLRSTITALKESGVEFVVFLSSFTIPTDKGLRDIPSEEMIPHWHAQVEVNLEDIFGDGNYVALRPGVFITNNLAQKKGIVEGKMKLHGGGFEQDNIVPADIGRVAGHVLVEGPKQGQKKVYVYGPQIRTMKETIVQIGKELGKELQIEEMGEEEAIETKVAAGIPPVVAKYLTKVYGTSGTDKGNGVRFPNYEEGVNNVQLYTGKPSTSLKAWVDGNKAIFDA